MRRGLCAGVASVFIALVAAPAALADDSVLSTRLQELATPDLRDASRADQADAVSLLPKGAGSLSRADGGLVVEIRVDGDDHARSLALADAGANILHVSHEYDTVTAVVDESELRSIAAVPGVEYVGEVITPMTGSVEGQAGAINTCATGVVSEGNTQLRADVAKTQFDVDGGGVKVGIMSDSYDTKTTATTHAAGDVSSADLPGAGNPCGRTEPVQVLDDSAGVQGDEGRAMLQIVHDIAPGASLAFATAFTGQTAFADNIRALANNGAKIIADDIIYFTEPMYQDGIIAQAVNDVTAQGVAYFSMAFNNNGLGVNSYEAPNGYRDDGATTCPAVVTTDRAGGQNDCMDFDPGPGVDNTFDVNVAAGGPFRLSLSWAEPSFGITDDFDVYVLNVGSISLAGKTDNIASGAPNEFGSFTVGGAGSRQIVVRRYSGTGAPRIKLVQNDNGAQTWQSTQSVTAPDIQGPTIYGHNGAAAAETVGAVPFNNSNTMETFSGRGPVVSVFAPVNGTTPSAAFGSPITLSKPDVSATDRGITTFFGSGNRFSGTSAAAPHAAAVGALQLSANSALTSADIFGAQEATARPVGAFTADAMGAGLIDAQAAIASKPPAAPSIAITNRPGPTTNITTPTFDFTVTGHTNAITCDVDGAVQACTSPFTPAAPLADGTHTVTIGATDFFGQAGSQAASFTVDTTAPPSPKFNKGPKKKTSKRKATFTFTAEAGATFMCALDKAAFATCTSPAKVKVKKAKPKKKKHTFAVEAIDAAGNVGAAATYKWTVQKKKKRKHHH